MPEISVPEKVLRVLQQGRSVLRKVQLYRLPERIRDRRRRCGPRVGRYCAEASLSSSGGYGARAGFGSRCFCGGRTGGGNGGGACATAGGVAGGVGGSDAIAAAAAAAAKFSALRVSVGGRKGIRAGCSGTEIFLGSKIRC